MNKNYFASNLKFLRTQKNESQLTIGNFFGKRSTSISSWEMGHSQPSLDDLVSLSDYFGIYVGDLIGKDLEKEEDLKKYLDDENEEEKGEFLGENRHVINWQNPTVAQKKLDKKMTDLVKKVQELQVELNKNRAAWLASRK